MLNKINLEDPMTYAIIGFVVIFAYQYYTKRISHKKDEDDYTNDSDILSLVKIPLLTGFLIWIVCNFLTGCNKNNNMVSNVIAPAPKPVAKPVLPVKQPSSKELALRDIFTEQPNF